MIKEMETAEKRVEMLKKMKTQTTFFFSGARY
jgi:hypothetical protein